MIKMRNEPESLKELLRQVAWIADLDRKVISSHPAYLCIVVQEEYFDRLSSMAEQYGHLGHSWDREHIYLRANSHEKGEELLKMILSEDGTGSIGGVYLAYVTSSEPAPGIPSDPQMAEFLKKRELYDVPLRIPEDWPIIVHFYQAIQDADKMDEMVEKLKQYGKIDYRGPNSFGIVGFKPYSEKHLRQLEEWRQDETVSGIQHLSFNGYIEPEWPIAME